MRILSAHKKPISCLAFSPDGSQLAEAAHGGRVRVWDLASGEVARAFEESNGLFPNQVKVAFVDERLLAVANDRASIVGNDGETRERLPGKSSSFHAIQVSPDGSQLVSSGDEFQRWDLKTRELLRGQQLLPVGETSHHTYPATAFGRGGTRLAVCRKEWKDRGNESKLFVVNLASEAVETNLSWFGHEAKRLSFHPSLPLLAGTCGPALRVWNLESNAEVAALAVGKLHFLAAAFSPCGRHLVAVSKDKTARFWDAVTFAEAKTFDWEIGKLLDLAFAPDGSMAAVAGDAGKIALFDLD